MEDKADTTMRRLSVMFYRVQGSLEIQATRKSKTYNSVECPQRRSRNGTANCLNTEMPAILMRRVIDGREQTASVHHAEPLTTQT